MYTLLLSDFKCKENILIYFMKETRPTCDPNGVYSVKRTCAELGVSHKTLMKYRKSGYITPLNPGNIFRPKYSGESIINCWDRLIRV